MATIRVTTRESASLVGQSATMALGAWRNSVDGCDSDGHGRVFIDVADEDYDYIASQLDADDRVVGYDRV